MAEAVAETVTEEQFEPTMVGFLCNWCCYAGADLCGVSRYQYPPNLRVIRVMCSTRIDPFFIIEAFKNGADGVFIGGCHPGDCHYITGNYHTVNKVAMAKQLITHAGVNPDRLRLEWVSASEGEQFSKVITEFTDTIRGLGPCKAPTDIERSTNLSGAKRAALSFRLRSMVGREYNLKQEGNVYGEDVVDEDLDRLINEAIEAMYIRGLILELTIKEPRSVKQLAAEINKPAHEILNHIVYLRGNNLVTEAGLEGYTPLYQAAEFIGGGD